MTGDWTSWILIALIIALFIWNMSRRRKSGNANLDAAVAVFTDINTNMKVLDERVTNSQSGKKFAIRNWMAYRERLTFLDSSLMSSLNESFAMMEEFNSRIDSAKKNKALYTLQDMQLEKLRDPLTKSKEGLLAWLKTTYEAEQHNNPRRGCLGV